MWKRPDGLHSSQYLAGPIHNKVFSEYYQIHQGNEKEIEEYKNKARRLQELLYDLKNYKDPEIEKHIFKEEEYNLFLNAFGSVTNRNGTPLSNTFLGQSIKSTNKGNLFEEQLVNIQKALILSIQNGMKEKNISESFSQDLNGSISIQTGNNKTSINFPDVPGRLNKIILHDVCQVNTYKVLKQKGVKTRHFYVKDVQPKIDVINLSQLKISAEIRQQFPNLAEFAQLFLQSTITAKNYKESTINKYGVSLGKTQIFRIIADFIPTLHIIESRQQEISFQYAIFKRYGFLVKYVVNADYEIPDHFYHIQNIYELMGVGQSIKNPDLKEVQDYIKNGAELLIVNTHNTKNIYVRSTRDILHEMWNRGLPKTYMSPVGRKVSLDSSYFK